MRRISFALTVLLLCALCLSACGAGIGVSYDEFVTRYTENVLFINDNTGRHLLPHTLVRDYDANGRRIYTVNKGALSMEMQMDETGFQVVSCVITLTAPAELSHGTAQYNDFAAAGYHSYAMLMAMSPETDPVLRYAVVEEVNAGLAPTGAYATQVGDYRLDAATNYGVATLRLQNELFAAPESDAEKEESSDGPTVEIIDDEEEDSRAG